MNSRKNPSDRVVSGDELVKIIQSKEFRYRLAKAAKITNRTGHETGFTVRREVQSNFYYWSPVFEGFTDEVNREDVHDWENTLPNPYRGKLDLI